MHLMFVCEHYLFLHAKGFPRGKLEDNYKIQGRYTVPGRGTVPYAREKLFTNSLAFVARMFTFRWYDFMKNKTSLVL